MPELLHIAAFWAVVVVVIRLAVCCLPFRRRWVALQWDASLVNSLFFLVLSAVVIPALGGCRVIGRNLRSRPFDLGAVARSRQFNFKLGTCRSG
jgi:hypothetical protein